VLALLEALGQEATLGSDKPGWALPHAFHPGRYASVAVDGQTVAVLGQLHPRLQRDLGLDRPLTTFHVDFETLLALEPARVMFTAPPRFPSIEFHLNVLAGSRHLAGDLLGTVIEADLTHLVRHGIRDVYTGDGVQDGFKRVTLELEFNNAERSLVQEEVLTQVARLRTALRDAGVQPEG
jgi:phenylalanyl-tRNA synthetase beta chain